MPPKKGARAKRFRKTISDIGERRVVGPVGDSDDDYSDMDMELLRRQKRRKLNEDAAKAAAPTETAIPAAAAAADSGSDGDSAGGAAPDTSQAATAKQVDEKDAKDIFSTAIASALGEGNDGLLGGYSLREQKREERAKRKLEKKRLKKKRAFDVEGGQGYISESSESEASEDERMAAKRLHAKRAMKKQMLTQAHNRPTASLAQPDYEKSLRRVATKGVVRLFNAVALAQKEKAPEEEDAAAASKPAGLTEPGEHKGKVKPTGPSKDQVTRSKFLEMLRKGSESKHIQDKEDTAKAERDARKAAPVKKPRHNKK